MAVTTLTRAETWSLLTLVAACVGVLAKTFQDEGEPVIASIALSGIAFAGAFSLIRWLGDVFIKAGLKGQDMCKLRRVEMYAVQNPPKLLAGKKRVFANICHSPETMGAVCAVVYILSMIIFIPFPFYRDIVSATSGGGNRDVVLSVHHAEAGRFLHRFPHNKVRLFLFSSGPSVLLISLYNVQPTNEEG